MSRNLLVIDKTDVIDLDKVIRIKIENQPNHTSNLKFEQGYCAIHIWTQSQHWHWIVTQENATRIFNCFK